MIPEYRLQETVSLNSKKPQGILKQGGLALLLVLLCSAELQAALYYRYENDQGIKVITQAMPPQFVHKGYEILNDAGRVVKVVPRALTEQERAALSEQERDKRAEAEQLERDRRLLSIFSSPEDAERAQERKLEAIDVYINVTRGNINKLRGDYNNAQAQAAQKERAGQAVPEFLVTKMDNFQRQISEAEASIVEKENEKEMIRKEYAKDIDRLRYLVEQRKKAQQELMTN